jgi:2,4-dienoyl-CoA reductase-like NADH-dependent reductase (Old Yellow Enzyme family)
LVGMRKAARDALGREPVLVLQLTHSGRYSRPVDRPAPIIAHHSEVLDPRQNLPADYPLITDDELDSLQGDFARAAVLAADVGFDAVGIKSCHRYLFSELLASHTRTNSRYGGSYENRTRMLRETVAAVLDAVGDRIDVVTRINAYDGIRYPYGWGVDESDMLLPDLAEPIRLVRELKDLGISAVNVTIGNPYSNPHVNRPADRMVVGAPDAPEPPLVGVARIIGVASRIQQAQGDVPIVGSGYSWLRQYFPHFASAVISAGGAAMVGLGRGALAYPDFARDILERGAMDPEKVCITCSACTQIMRDHGQSGCVVRDAKVYAPILREGRLRAAKGSP